MSKKITVFFVLLTMVSIFSLYCSKPPQDSLKPKYEALSKEFNEKLKTIKTREQFNNLLKERNQRLEALVKGVDENKISDNDKLILGKIYIETKKFDKAISLLNKLTSKPQLKKDAYKYIIEAYLSKRDVKNTSLYLDRVLKEIKDLKDFAPYFLIGGLNNREPSKIIEYLDIAFKYRLSPPFSNYIGYAIDSYIKAKKLSPEESKRLFTRMKNLYSSDQRALQQIEKKETLLSLIGSQARDIDIKGDWINTKNPITIKSLKGKKYVVLEFWAPWCPHCRGSLPHMEELYKNNKDKLQIIGITAYYGSFSDGTNRVSNISKEKEFALIKDFLKKQGITFPVIVTSDRSLSDSYGVEGIPTFVIISKDGKVLQRVVGARPDLYDMIREIIKK